MDEEEDSVERPQENVSETTQFSIDETQEVVGVVEELEPDSGELANVSETIDSSGKSSKKKPGKLPPVPKGESLENSTLAADDVLRQFFKRR